MNNNTMPEPQTPYQLFKHLNNGGTIRLGNWTMKSMHTAEGEHVISNGTTIYCATGLQEALAILVSLNGILVK